MSESKLVRITKVLRELNIPLKLAVEFLKSNNHDIKKHPNTKITLEQYSLLFNEFYSDKSNMFETDKGINKKLSENSQNRQKHRVRKELDLNSIKDLKIKANLNFKGKTIKLHELSSKKVKENKFVKVKNDNVEKKWSKKGNRNVNFKEKTSYLITIFKIIINLSIII